MSPKLTVVIVNYKVREFLSQTLQSLQGSAGYDELEVLVVDNNSQDGSEEMVLSRFPAVQWIGLQENIGFGKACNLGAQKATAPYILMLNPDTVISEHTIDQALLFFKQHPEAGIVGPKVLNEDGTFQYQCRRSFPTPLNALSYFFGLHKLFPDSKHLGDYCLTWAPIDEVREVDAISGACLFIRTDLYQKVGGFDEQFFMYGEDLDLCAQVQKEGYKVYYDPSSEIIHFKGKSSAQRQLKSKFAFYEAMILFSKKHKRSYGTFFPSWFLSIGIILQALLTMGSHLLKSFPVVMVDLILINTVIPFVTAWRYLSTPNILPYYDPHLSMMTIHLLASGVFITVFALTGHYRTIKIPVQKTLHACLLSTTIFLALLLLLRQIAFSRIALVGSSLMISAFLVGWRAIVPRVSAFHRRFLSGFGKIIIVGSEETVPKAVQQILKHQNGYIRGVIIPENSTCEKIEIAGFPVLGSTNNLGTLLTQYTPDTLLVAPDSSWYTHLITSLSTLSLQGTLLHWYEED